MKLQRSSSLFEERWWLDAVAPDTWREIQVAEGAESSARAVVQVVRKWGIVFVRNPPLTPIVGPAFSVSAQKHETRMAQSRALVDRIIRVLPAGHVVRLTFSPGFDDYLPFRWAGFQVGLSCTYRLNDLGDVERSWHELSESCRRAIRKARRLVTVRDDPEGHLSIQCIEKTFERQGLSLPFSKETLLRAVRAARQRGAVMCLVAEDSGGRAHGSAIIVHDERSAYYLAGGADPDFRGSGAQSLLLWSAIERVSRLSLAFDFEGSSNPHIERFFRSFGARRTPLIAVSRRSPFLRVLDGTGLLPAALRGI